MRPRSLAALIAACAAVGSLWWLARPAPELGSVPRPPALPSTGDTPSRTDTPTDQPAAQREPDPEAKAAVLAPGPVPGEPAAKPAAAGSEPSEVPPLSPVHHRVLRSWGATPGSGSSGPRELHLVVEPSLGTSELEQLLRDALAQHTEAEVLTIRIYDSEAAVTYDRHSDGGALAERHLVASMSRHRRLGVESLRVRGVELDP